MARVKRMALWSWWGGPVEPLESQREQKKRRDSEENYVDDEEVAIPGEVHKGLTAQQLADVFGHPRQ